MSDVLRIEDLDTAGQWLHFDVGPHLKRSYRQATRWRAARDRPDHPRACTSNGCYLIRVDSDVRGEQARRRRVHVVTGLRQRDGAAVAEVGFVLDWPVVTPCG